MKTINNASNSYRSNSNAETAKYFSKCIPSPMPSWMVNVSGIRKFAFVVAFLVVTNQIYKRVRPSVRLSVGHAFGYSSGHAFAFRPSRIGAMNAVYTALFFVIVEFIFTFVAFFCLTVCFTLSPGYFNGSIFLLYKTKERRLFRRRRRRGKPGDSRWRRGNHLVFGPASKTFSSAPRAVVWGVWRPRHI